MRIAPLLPHSILNLRGPVLGLLLLAASCNGTEGTLVVRHDGASGSAAGGAPAVVEKPYVPPENVRFFVQLDGAVDLQEAADLFYLDVEQETTADLAELHAQGRHYLCYLSGGSWEDFRADAADFPMSAVGNQLADFPRERWLDVRDPSVRELMARRVETLAASGCDGVPPSSLAVHAADSGFDLTLDDTLDYARWLAERIHAAGMSVGLSGPVDMTSQLWPSFDFGLAIGCVAGTQCSEYAPLEKAGKTVLHIELGNAAAAPQLCKSAQALGFDALVSDAGFTGHCVACRDIL